MNTIGDVMDEVAGAMGFIDKQMNGITSALQLIGNTGRRARRPEIDPLASNRCYQRCAGQRTC